MKNRLLIIACLCTALAACDKDKYGEKATIDYNLPVIELHITNGLSDNVGAEFFWQEYSYRNNDYHTASKFVNLRHGDDFCTDMYSFDGWSDILDFDAVDSVEVSFADNSRIMLYGTDTESSYNLLNKDNYAETEGSGIAKNPVTGEKFTYHYSILHYTIDETLHEQAAVVAEE